ncbi:hypothetical protein NDU88_004975 [Pleurodeles waltl]|uniref:Uncharacterized protein n=1 Tax=Pleurodeles waltl TaxID=8319 RepID=A0AAV7WXD1_PLEWA|nr:hypothetical protein NDU88_004975 [Pleurodeles waltl]
MRTGPRPLLRFQLRRLDRKGLIGSPGARQTHRVLRSGHRIRPPPPAGRSFCSCCGLLSSKVMALKGRRGSGAASLPLLAAPSTRAAARFHKRPWL